MDSGTVVEQPAPHPKYVNGEQLGAEITELCGYLYAGTYRLLVMIREFDAEGYWELPGLTSCAHWLNLRCGIGMNAAREKVRVARALAELPKVSAAFSRGELSYSKVRAMTRIANAANEDYLLMIARHGSAWHLETLIAKYRRAARDSDAATAAAQQAARACTVHYDADGCLVIRARYPADQGALVVKALEHAMERRFRAGDDGKGPEQAVHDVAAEEPEREPISRRRADALAEVAESYLAAGDTVSATADRYQVVVHVAADTLKSVPECDAGVSAETSLPGLGDPAYLEQGPHLAAETARRVACDSGIVRLAEDEDGVPLSIGRRSRAIPPALRRALTTRDGGCRFPGCTNTRFVDGHHVRHWADGGETSLDNLVLLCRRHHGLVHEGGFRCEHGANGHVVFHAPSGENLSAQRQATGIAHDADVMRWLDRYMPELEVAADTCVPRWYAGERMDWDLAVGALFQ
ncbi:MAG TPA: DUF222 domain-containing protein [Woeseiaceae bacterium]|nr:DUF222 domain-containing protein [Woeseiaceae bacterium]